MDLSVLARQEKAVRETYGGKLGWRLLPGTAQEVATLLQAAKDSAKQVALSSADAALMAEPVLLDLHLLNNVRQYPSTDFVIQVETGMTFGQLQEKLQRRKQQFPLTYPPDMVLADILAQDRPALETGLRGYPRDYVLKTELAAPDGQLTISGADVVKNVTGYDLAKLYVGGHHAFGVLTSVTLKLLALPEERRQWLYAVDTLAAAARLTRQLREAHLPLTVCEILKGAENVWQVIFEIAGDSLLLDECQSVLWELSSAKPQPFATQEAQVVLAKLRQWPSDQLVVEAAVPLGRWLDVAREVMKEPVFASLGVQIRPAAGLLYWQLPSAQPELLAFLQRVATSQGGFVQIAQMGRTDVAPEIWQQWAACNLPTDVFQRRLLQTLKNGYDPQGTLFTPRFPL